MGRLVQARGWEPDAERADRICRAFELHGFEAKHYPNHAGSVVMVMCEREYKPLIETLIAAVTEQELKSHHPYAPGLLLKLFDAWTVPALDSLYRVGGAEAVWRALDKEQERMFLAMLKEP